MHGEKNDRVGAEKAPPPPNGIRVKSWAYYVGHLQEFEY